MNSTNGSFLHHLPQRGTSTQDTDLSKSGVAVLSSIYVLIFAIGPTSNAAVIYIITCRHKKRAAGDLFVVFLASVDFLASFFIPITMIPDIITNHSDWYFGALGCKVLPLIPPITIFASVWTLVAIAVDRYRYEIFCLDILYGPR